MRIFHSNERYGISAMMVEIVISAKIFNFSVKMKERKEKNGSCGINGQELFSAALI